MAKATLPTNFKDDILASSMGSKRRYNVINNSDGTISLEDVTTYTQVGSTFGAAQINATNKAANAAADASKIIDDYDTLMANTQAGYMAGALAVKEMNSNLSNNLTWTLYSSKDIIGSSPSLSVPSGKYMIVATTGDYNYSGAGITVNGDYKTLIELSPSKGGSWFADGFCGSCVAYLETQNTVTVSGLTRNYSRLDIYAVT